MRVSQDHPLSQGEYLRGITAARATAHFGITHEKLREMTRNDPFLLNAAVEPNQSATQIRISPHKLAAALERQRADQIDAAASRVERQFRRYGGFDLVNAAECLLVARWFERNGHNRIARFLRINAGVRIAVAVTGSMQEPLAAKVVAGPKQQALS